MEPLQVRNFLWFINTLVMLGVMGSAGYIIHENQKYKAPQIPEPPPVVQTKQVKVERIFEYSSIWEAHILPEAPKVAPPPSGPSAFEELDALLQVEKGIGGEGIAKEHSYATILFKKDNKLKKLVYVKDVFEPSQLLWHRGSDLSKVQDLSRCATILDITNEKVTFNFREEEVILEIKTKNVNAHGRPLGTGGSPPVESKLITENHWKISKEERDQVLKKPEDYLKQVGLVAYYEKGNFAGVKLKEVPSGSLPEKRGFQKNDVVTHINGMRISSMQHLETLAKSEQNKRQFTLNLLRLGKTINLRFDVD